MLFPFFTIFILLLLILNYLRAKAIKSEQEQMAKFWDKEARANQTRRKDISNLPYVEIPLSELPLGVSDSSYCQKLEEQLKDLSQKKILNLSGISNTDLKLEYGAANLTVLSEYDQNFSQLSNLLYNYGKALHEEGFKTEAVCVLEYGISIQTDMSRMFVLLASIYKEDNNTEKIKELLEKTSCLSPLLKDSTEKQLKSFL